MTTQFQFIIIIIIIIIIIKRAHYARFYLSLSAYLQVTDEQI